MLPPSHRAAAILFTQHVCLAYKKLQTLFLNTLDLCNEVVHPTAYERTHADV